ncbi:MAG: SGNH/GDSL hydrolase family protein [Tahibacter sp.]
MNRYRRVVLLALAWCAAIAGSSPIAAAVLDCSRIMPLGDSITLGVNGGYRNRLYTRLAGLACNVGFVGSLSDQYTLAADKDHEGHSGFSIGDIARDANPWLVAQAPDIVLLMIGTNDVAWWSVRTADEVAADHAGLIDQIRSARPNAWIVVGSIAPLASADLPPLGRDRAEFGREFNAAVRVRIDARIRAGEKVRYADIYARLSITDLYDGVHPTQLAHDKVADAWYATLEGILTTGGDRIYAGNFQ